MNKKTLTQFFLGSIIILIFLVIFFKYFNQETSNKIVKNIEKKEIDKNLSQKSNLIKDIEYFSKDETGSIYSINAESGKINDDNPDIIFLTNVKAKISTLNSEDIFIQSDVASHLTEKANFLFYKKIFENL